MIRRRFLQAVGAAVLGVVAARVPVFAEDISELDQPTQLVSMWVYPATYAIPVLGAPKELYAVAIHLGGDNANGK